jgi:hypothetical protein
MSRHQQTDLRTGAAFFARWRAILCSIRQIVVKVVRMLLAKRGLLSWGITAAFAALPSCSSSDPANSPGAGGGSDGGEAGGSGGGESLQDGATGGSEASAGASGAAPEASDTIDANRDHCNGAVLPVGGPCPGRTPTSGTIIGSVYSTSGTITYGTDPDLWDVDTFVGPGQSRPSLTAGAGTLSISATLTRPMTGQGWSGIAVLAGGPKCIDESNFARGIAFTLSGNLGGCLLYVDAVTSQNESSASDPCRGACAAGEGGCAPANAPITDSGMITVPNMLFAEGSPTYAPDTSQLIGFRWRLTTSDAAPTCSANISISNVGFFGI